MKILDLDKERYEVAACSFGELKVYHTPEPMIWAVVPDEPEPEQPVIEMKTATGRVQKRLSKLGDPEYEVWQKKAQKYATLTNDLQYAARYVYALKDLEYPDDLSTPPSQAPTDIPYPEHDLLRKKYWLDCTVFAKASDILAIQQALQKLNGTFEEVTPEAVDEVKKNSTSE